MPSRSLPSALRSCCEPELDRLRAIAKSLALLALIALVVPLQSLVLLCSHGRASMRLPPRFHAAFATVLGLEVSCVGTPLVGRGVVHVCNHLSYLDVQVLGRLLRTRFVAKEDVRAWPLFGLLSRLQQTVFVSRSRARAGEAGDALARALAGPHGLLVFAEGTTSDGAAVLPFKSSLFAAVLAAPGALVQPVRIDLLAVDGVEIAAGAERSLYAYHGEAVLVPHLWRFMRGSGARLRVSFLEPIAAATLRDRKSLARAAWAAVAGSASVAEPA